MWPDSNEADFDLTVTVCDPMKSMVTGAGMIRVGALLR
jgi:hypothetical protein